MKKLSILIVDDDDAMRGVLSRLLRSHDVCPVANVQEAVAILDTGRQFDVVLSDVMMPGGSGLDLHRLLARQRPMLASRLLFVTGGVGSHEQLRALEASGRPVVAKPFDRKQLRELVEQVAGSRDWATLVGLASQASRVRKRAAEPQAASSDIQ